MPCCCLVDEGVALHTLPDLKLVSLASRSAKATAFAWSAATRQLAVANKKKVSTYRWVGA